MARDLTSKAGAAFAVAHVRLHRADEQRLLRGVAGPRTVEAIDGRQLLAVPHYRAGSVCLHILDV